MRFDAAQFNDDVAVFETLHHSADDFPDALAIFRVDIFPLGFAHLLEDDLFRCLRGNPSQIFGRTRKFDFHVDLSLVAV